MAHSVINTVTAMIDKMPENNDFTQELKEFKNSIFLELPEDNINLWRKLGIILDKYLPRPKKGSTSNDWIKSLNQWELEIFYIWMNAEK